MHRHFTVIRWLAVQPYFIYISSFPSTYFATHINTLKINNFPHLFTSLRTTILTKTNNYFTFSLHYTQQHWQKPIISLLHTTLMKLKLIIQKISASPTQLKNRNTLKWWIYWKVSNHLVFPSPLLFPFSLSFSLLFPFFSLIPFPFHFPLISFPLSFPYKTNRNSCFSIPT